MQKPIGFLTKVCSACGQRKPISSFIVSQQDNNIQYSPICEACRNLKEDETQRTSVGGARITNVEKQKQSRTRYESKKEMEETYYAEREKGYATQNKKEKQQTDKLDETIKKRENFFSSSQPASTSSLAQRNASPTREAEIQPEAGMQIPQERFLKGEAVAKYAALLGENSPLARMLGKSKFSSLFEKSVDKFAKQVTIENKSTSTETKQNDALEQVNKITRKNK